MSTNGDYSNLIVPDSDGQIVKPTYPKDVPVEVPTVQLADILPSTGFVIVRDMLTETVLANSTGFFVSPSIILTAAHAVAPLIRRFHVQLEVVSNSRSIDGIRTYPVAKLAYDFETTPCQILLQINTNHTHYLPLSKEPAEDGSMVRVLSNSPIGFGGIHLDGIVSRVFDVWKEGTEQQCFRERSIAKYNWYCDQERFLISTPTWPGASGSPVIAATGVIGTVETDGPHIGTAIAASTLGLIIPPESAFIPVESLHPALLWDGSLEPQSSSTNLITHWLSTLWAAILSLFGRDESG
jgi:hypothetical protein